MIEEKEVYESEEIKQAQKNYDELVNKYKTKNALEKLILGQSVYASISLVFCLIMTAGIPVLLTMERYGLAVLVFLGAVYEAWWFLRKLLGCITLIVGGVKNG